ncbi:MAG TPA: bacterial transcriptional activator domain-containing protein [Acidimicrobiales bacterium]|nr:bacterial transcriptional activator domain-containing protein [Acidimicrobiales bacterium]
MSRSSREPPIQRDTLTRGLAALTKSALLVLGVPVAAIRLWQFSSIQSYSLHIGLIIDVVLGLVGVFWIFAVFQLSGEVLRTLRAPDTASRGSWSGSWAAGIVGLLLLAGGMSMHGSTPRSATAVVRTMHERTPHRANQLSQRDQNSIATKAALGLGALIGAALLGRTRQLGRLRLSLRAPGGAAEIPNDEVQSLVRELASVSNDRLVDWVEAVNRLLGGLFLTNPVHDAPEIALLRVAEEGIEILLRRPQPHPPAPFYSSEGGFWWHLERGLTLEALRSLGGQSARFLPPLIPVGSDGAGEILVAVNPGQVLGICGEEASVDAALEACLTAIRVLPWCDELSVEMVGVEPPPLDEQSVHMQRSNLETLLMLRDRPNTARSKLVGSWQREPIVIIGRNALNGTARHALIGVARRFGAIVAGIHGEITLTVTDDTAKLAPFGITLHLHQLHPLETSLVDRLLQTYTRALPVVSLTASERSLKRAVNIEITILGENVEISGAQRQPHIDDLPRIHELLVFLCLHGHEASTSQVRDEIFADFDDRSVARRIDNLLATTRATLGRSPTGDENIWLNEKGIITLDRSITLDWFELLDDITAARNVEGARAMELLDRSLRVIQPGKLLAEVTLYPWFQAMRYGEYIKAILVDACHHLITLAQDSNQPDTLRAALALGHEIEPGSEIIARDLMVVADQEGNGQAIETIFRDLQTTLEKLGGAEPSALTNRLFHSLTSSQNSTEH